MAAEYEPFAPMFDWPAAFADRVVIADGTGTVFRGYELASLVGRVAALSASLGIKAGDRVLVQVPKSIEALAVYLGLVRTGAVFSVLSDEVTLSRLEEVVDDAMPALVIAPRRTLDALAGKLRVSRVRLAMSLEADGSGSFLEMARSQKPARVAPAVRGSDLAALIYPPKAAGQPLRGIKHAVTGLRLQIEMAKTGLGLAPADIVAHGLSRWAEPASLALAGAALSAGAQLLWVRPTDGCDPSIGESAAATVVVWDTARPFAEHTLPAAARCALCRSEPDPRCPRMRRYVALPETGFIGVEEEDGSARLLAGGEARLRDAAGVLVTNEGTGLLEVAGAHLFTGYWRRADASHAILDNGGFFPTGLAGRRRPDGTIVVAGQP